MKKKVHGLILVERACRLCKSVFWVLEMSTHFFCGMECNDVHSSLSTSESSLKDREKIRELKRRVWKC